jgi:hypothetical protein
MLWSAGITGMSHHARVLPALASLPICPALESLVLPLPS